MRISFNNRRVFEFQKINLIILIRKTYSNLFDDTSHQTLFIVLTITFEISRQRRDQKMVYCDQIQV
jgi:hypothetical protein